MHFDGIITLESSTPGIPGCPQPLQGDEKLNADVMAIFWSSFATGRLSMMSFDMDEPLAASGANPIGINEIKEDLQKGFNSDAVAFARDLDGEREVTERTIGDISKAYLFTWEVQNGVGSKKVSQAST